MTNKLQTLLLAFAVFFLASCLANSGKTKQAELEKLPPLSPQELKVLKIMGGRVLPDGNIGFGKVTLDRRTKEVTFPAKVNIAEDDVDLEVLICTPTGRTHESLLVSEIDPYHLQLALLLSGASNGTRIPLKNKDGKEPGVAQGSLIDIYLEPEKMERFPVEQWLKNKTTKREKKKEGWVFVGSSFTSNKTCMATEEGNIVNVWSFGNTILDNQAGTGDTDDIFVSYSKRMFPYETPVKVIMKKREK